MADLLPCPFCGGKAKIGPDEHYPEHHVVRCQGCGVYHFGSHLAERWQRRTPPPATLVWTSEPPKVPGWYWFRSYGVAEMIQIEDWDIGRAWATSPEWAGPIPEPQEPDAASETPGRDDEESRRILAGFEDSPGFE